MRGISVSTGVLSVTAEGVEAAVTELLSGEGVVMRGISVSAGILSMPVEVEVSMTAVRTGFITGVTVSVITSVSICPLTVAIPVNSINNKNEITYLKYIKTS